MKKAVFGVLVGLGVVCFGGYPEDLKRMLPDPEPVFQPGRIGRIDAAFSAPEMNVDGTTMVVPSFGCGNKGVWVRRCDGRYCDERKTAAVYIDGREAVRVFFLGSTAAGGGHPFAGAKGEKDRVEADGEKKEIRYVKPYIFKEGKRAEFTYRLRSLGGGKVELEWDAGVTQAEADAEKGFSLTPLVKSMYGYHYGMKLVSGGEELKTPGTAKLLEGAARIATAGRLEVRGDKAERSWAIESEAGKGMAVLSASNSDEGPKHSMDWVPELSSKAVRGKFTIDLMECAIPKDDLPPAVGGIDFWGLDALHVPESPNKNKMPNPSFEQGLRYWKWCGGGALWEHTDLPRYDLAEGGKFGRRALLIRSTQSQTPGVTSFPIALEAGKKWTASFWAKADEETTVLFGLSSAARIGKFNSPEEWGSKDRLKKVGKEWTRISRTFTSDAYGVSFALMNGSKNMRIDGFQLEEGEKATDFEGLPVDANFITSDPDCQIRKGSPIHGAMIFTGKARTEAKVKVTARNLWREEVFRQDIDLKLSDSGYRLVQLDMKEEEIGSGIFVVRADIAPAGGKAYTLYYRMTILAPLDNRHATKDIFGCHGAYGYIGRSDDLARKLREWGYGSCSWSYNWREPHYRPYFEIPNRIRDYVTIVGFGAGVDHIFKDWKAVTDADVAKVEKKAEEDARNYDLNNYPVFAFANEEEGYVERADAFDEHCRMTMAVARGVKKANPKAMVAQSCGVSGYSKYRSYQAMEGYLKASVKAGFRYDAIAVHPYANIDKGKLSNYDMDEETARLIGQMKRYGYGPETPILYTEAFNVCHMRIPVWGAEASYDSYSSGSPGYDIGNRERIHAASAARMLIITLKYWPHVRSCHIWTHPYMFDLNLTPLAVSAAVNTLGHHFGWVKFRKDIRPAGGIRGYAFDREDGTGAAAVWCVNHDVEDGIARGPKIRVKFGQEVELRDLMNNVRLAKTDAEGYAELPLTPEPIIVRAKDSAKLAEALAAAETDDVTAAVQATVLPNAEGETVLTLKNLTGREQKGKVSVNGEEREYLLPPMGEEKAAIGKEAKIEYGKIYTRRDDVKVASAQGGETEVASSLSWFYAPKTQGMPKDWSAVPGIELDNRILRRFNRDDPKTKVRTWHLPKTGEGDFAATLRAAYDKDSLYVRVEVKDDVFLPLEKNWEDKRADTLLYLLDGCLEIYFDTCANARAKAVKNYDDDDYRYDFSVNRGSKFGKAMVTRMRAVDRQLADGLNMPEQEEIREKLDARIERTAEGYTYTIEFKRRYIEPIVLKEGELFGFGAFLHDRDREDEPFDVKGLSLATEPGERCDAKPHLWPLMILK